MTWDHVTLLLLLPVLLWPYFSICTRIHVCVLHMYIMYMYMYYYYMYTYVHVVHMYPVLYMYVVPGYSTRVHIDIHVRSSSVHTVPTCSCSQYCSTQHTDLYYECTPGIDTTLYVHSCAHTCEACTYIHVHVHTHVVRVYGKILF